MMCTFEERSEEAKLEIERVRERTKSHPSHYSSSAVATCRQLVFPVLRAIGWDPDDPVTTHFVKESQVGRIRMALRREGGGSVLLDVNAMGTEMELPRPAKIDELLIGSGVADGNVVACTDGEVWVVFRKDDGWRKHVKHLQQSENYELWHWVDGRLGALRSHEGSARLQPVSDWHALNPRLPRDSKPISVRFCDGVTVSVNTWKAAYVAIGEYFVRSGKLSLDELPVSVTKLNNQFNIVPEHPDGRRFRTPFRLTNDIWMESFINSKSLVSISIGLFRLLGGDRREVEFRFPSTRPQPHPTTPHQDPPRANRNWPSRYRTLPGLVNNVSGSKPLIVVTHNGKEFMLSNWANAFRNVVAELVRDERITKCHMPISLPNSRSKSIADLSPYHPDGRRFRTPLGPIDGIFFEVSGPAEQVIRWLLYLLDVARVPQDSVRVQLRNWDRSSTASTGSTPSS